MKIDLTREEFEHAVESLRRRAAEHVDIEHGESRDEVNAAFALYNRLVALRPAPPPEPARGQHYTVVEGDTLSGIAVRFGWQSGIVGAEAIMRANRLPRGDIQPGWVLFIPTEA